MQNVHSLDICRDRVYYFPHRASGDPRRRYARICCVQIFVVEGKKQAAQRASIIHRQILILCQVESLISEEKAQEFIPDNVSSGQPHLELAPRATVQWSDTPNQIIKKIAERFRPFPSQNPVEIRRFNFMRPAARTLTSDILLHGSYSKLRVMRFH